MDPKAPEKKERLLAALDQGMAMIHLDARRPGVLVPQNLRTEPHLRLNVSYRFDPPDLSVGEWGVRCTLSFSGSRFQVAVPWSALFAITSHVTREFWMFPDDMPPELMQLGAQEKASAPAPAPVPVKPTRAALRSVSARDADAAGDAPDEDPGAAVEAESDGKPPSPSEDPPKPKGRPHLRVVK